MLSLKKLQHFAEATVIKAGQVLLQQQRSVQIVKRKTDYQDIATTADLASEKIIIDAIKTNYPDHNIFSEEAGNLITKSDYTWVIDPLDGTKEYSRGLSEYAVLLSCQDQTKTLAAAIYFPAINDIYSASLNNGAQLNNQPIHISNTTDMSQAFIFGRSPGNYIPEPEFSLGWQALINVAKKAYRLRPGYFEARDFSWLARGAIDGLFIMGDYGPKWWDIASGLHIAQEAGAKVTDVNGQPYKLRTLDHGLVVANPDLHSQLLKIFNS